MSRPEVEDPKLAEVKAILAKLQRISADDDADELPAAPPPPPHPPVAAREPRDRAMPPPLPVCAPAVGQRSRLPLPAMLAGALAAAGVVYVAYPSLIPVRAPAARVPQVVAAAPPPAVAAPPTSPVVTAMPQPATPPVVSTSTGVVPQPVVADEKTGLQLAERMIGAGRITEGRQHLQAAGADRVADLAWALARAYDPNVVSSIAGADAGPDIEQAARWYRRWHALAQAQGLVSDGVSVERIIRAMPR